MQIYLSTRFFCVFLQKILFNYGQNQVNSNDYDFVLPLTVRDYELDVQGIVNNANYLHYLEHTRHAFCTAA